MNVNGMLVIAHNLLERISLAREPLTSAPEIKPSPALP